jgi:hypothetical protein
MCLRTNRSCSNDGASNARFDSQLAHFLQSLAPAVPDSVEIVDVDEVNQEVTHICSHFVVSRQFPGYQIREKPAERVMWTDAQPSSSWT